jgi:hypothetical protein
LVTSGTSPGAIAGEGPAVAGEISIGVPLPVEEGGVEAFLETAGGAGRVREDTGTDGMGLMAAGADDARLSVTKRTRRPAGGLVAEPRRKASTPRRSAWSRPDAATHLDHRPPDC